MQRTLRRNKMATYKKTWLTLTVLSLVLIMLPSPSIAQHKSTPAIYAESLREEYISLEQALWQYLGRQRSTTNRFAQLKKVIDSHRRFLDEAYALQNKLDSDKYSILNHYEWSILEKDLLEVDGYFEFFKNYLTRQTINATEYEERALLDLSEQVLRNDKKFSMARIFEDIELIMVKQALYYRAMTTSTEQICHTQQSTQQFVYSLYADIALTELKGYAMMEFSWMILRIYGKGNFTQEAELMRQDYDKRTERTLKLLREIMRRSDRILWRCDPNKFIKGQNYEEVTRLLQGYIENEVDLNSDETCRETCSFYQATRSDSCFKDKFCARQPKCRGRLYHCTFVDSDMSVCQSAIILQLQPQNSSRRYEYIQYENGRVLGKRGPCARGTTAVDSWWRYLFWHCSYCFCLCDEQGLKSDRYFNLRESVTDVKNNYVVTGLQFVKRNRIFHLQIQQGQLLPRAAVNASTIAWLPVADYKIYDRDVRNGEDFYTLSFENRSIDLDDINTDDQTFVVTGVRFRVLGAHLNLEAKLCEFDFETGVLISPEINCFWKSNDNTDVSGERRQKITLQNPDVSTESKVKSIPSSRHNQYIDFVNTSLDKDAAQSTVPFIDIQEVISHPPVPLSGIGLYHKGRAGFGGFLAPKIITYDFTPHVRMPKSIK